MTANGAANQDVEETARLPADEDAGLVDRVIEALRGVADPCCRERGISVVDMGLLEGVAIDEDAARIELVLTSGWCPFAVDLVEEVRDAVASLPDIEGAEVELVWDTAWTADRLSDDARRKLRFLPNPNEVTDRSRYEQAARAAAPGAGFRPATPAETDEEKEP